MIALAALIAAAASTPELAITFDDLPAHASLPAGETRVEIGDRIIGALKDAGSPPVYGFVNGVQLEREPDSAPVLDHWRAAGYPLGNHGWSHLGLSKTDTALYEAEIGRGEPLLAKLDGLGGDERWYRFPFLDEGSDPAKRLEVRRYLAVNRYRIAAVTMSFGDYAFNDPYARCVAKGDAGGIARLEQLYLKAAQATIAPTRALSQALTGRDIPYVLLMHLGALDARMLPQLLKLYKQEGFRLIALPDAERDPYYAADRDPSLPPQPASLEGRAAAKGIPAPPPAFDLAQLDTICR